MTFGEYKRSFCFERLALRLGIGFDVLKKYFDVSNADKSAKQVEIYEKAALASDGLKAEVIAAHEQNRKLLKRYLRQEIDLTANLRLLICAVPAERRICWKVLFPNLTPVGELQLFIFIIP